ncbi:hypothetical protein V8B55DRAFT_1147477 [Mucor lusitanicus]|uniref:Uncharacterized protein n=1 Tax=Mucor circinelloides f. lusitanicus TaxID=29924 RepID=A0A8H4BE31_MUCCL|nr:hypothetical protein FB192DRAFT_1115356 [Mucor lusitanicus]
MKSLIYIISTLIQHDFGYPVGFGEVKPGNSSTTKHSVCMDILRLGIAAKRAIDKWHLSGFLAFMINGLEITFFAVCKQHKHLYTMTKIGAMSVRVDGYFDSDLDHPKAKH